MPRTLLSQSRHFVLVLLGKREVPVVLGSQYCYTLLFHGCVRVTQLWGDKGRLVQADV